jgi:hypothetical protein
LRANLNATAYHEAGHAVIGRIVGMVCGIATIRADDDSAGHSITHDPYAIVSAWEWDGKFRDMRSVFIGRILTVMAGAEAQRMLTRSRRIGDGDDRYQVALMLEEAQRTETRLRSACQGLVRRHRKLITAVAQLLLGRGRLSRRELDRLIAADRADVWKRLRKARYQDRVRYRALACADERGPPLCRVL